MSSLLIRSIENQEDFSNKTLKDLIVTAQTVYDNCFANRESLILIKLTIKETGLIDQEKLNLSVLLYVQRFRVILYELEEVVDEENQKLELKLKSENKGHSANTAARIGISLAENNYTQNEMNKYEKININEIDSVIEPDSRRSLSLFSLDFSGKIFDFEASYRPEQLSEHLNEHHEEEDTLYKYFYQCADIKKLDYPSNHPVQGIDTLKLYNESNELGVLPDDWETFIDAHFKKYN